MKLSTAEFKSAVLLLEGALMDRYENLADKGAIGVVLYDYAQSIDEGIAGMSEGGLVDCDKLRGRVNAFLKAAGGKFVYKSNVNPLLRKLVGITIDEVAFTQADADYFFDEIIPSVEQAAQMAGK